jgi:DNA-binding CsgD family transcriptional regulator
MAGWTNQLDKALPYAAEGVALGKALDNPVVIGRALFDLAVMREYSGDFAATLEALVEGETHGRSASNPKWLAYTLAEIADMHLMLGPVEPAISFLDEALSLMEGVRYDSGIAYVRGVQGFAALAQERVAYATDCFLDSLDIARSCGDDRHWIGAAGGLSGVAHAAGRFTDAVEMLGAVETALVTTGFARLVYSNHIDPIRAELRARLGENAYRDAVQRGNAIPLDQAVAKLVRLIQDGLEERSTPADISPYALTARERDVLRLVVQGQSDRDIAAALFIGARTVETHVSNLIAKLGVHNRTEAAALATREGLV